jgi:hypothetical protein
LLLVPGLVGADVPLAVVEPASAVSAPIISAAATATAKTILAIVKARMAAIPSFVPAGDDNVGTAANPGLSRLLSRRYRRRYHGRLAP